MSEQVVFRSHELVQLRLRTTLRQRLERGVVISTPKRVWGGRGTGARCVICSRTITTNDVQKVVVVQREETIVKLSAHLPCLAIWEPEWARFEAQSTVPPTPSA